MARTAQKVRSLVAEEPAMEDALSVVLSRADDTTAPDSRAGETPDGGVESGTQPASDGGSTHAVTWGEVSDDLTSGQWGRLIQTGILTDRDGEGFAVADPEGVREGLADPEETDTDEEESGWSIYDKLAGLGAISMVPAYFVHDLTTAVGNAMDIIYHPINAVLPFYAMIIVISVFTGLYSALLMSNLMDMDNMGGDQDRLNEIQDELDAAQERDDDAAVERLRSEQMELMGAQFGMIKQQFRPMAWVMLLTIPSFIWMYWQLGIRGEAGQLADNLKLVLPLVGSVNWTDATVGPVQAWMVWYFLCSIGFRQVIQKSLNLRTSPDT